MWGAEAGLCGGVLAGGAVVLLALRCRRRKRKTVSVHEVHIVRDALPARSICAPRPPAPPSVPSPSLPTTTPASSAPPAPKRSTLAFERSPADDPPRSPPQILIVQNKSTPSSSEVKGIPKLPLPEQFIHKYKYSTTIPRPLTATLGGLEESRARKLSATRSPSLEKDERSFVSDKEVFIYEPNMSERKDEEMSSLKRYRSVSTRLNVCVNENSLDSPRVLQNSPRSDSASANKSSKFDFSPKILAECVSSPRFYTPPETVSPVFFAEPSPKSAYYDTVRSPKFFVDTPRDVEAPPSPRTLERFNRNGVSEKPSSPRVLGSRPSPKVHSCNKENYFTFDQVSLIEEGASRMSPRPRRYGGRNSLEKERYTPPADKEMKKYKRHNSCDTNCKNIELNISKHDPNVNQSKIEFMDADVVDCCAKIESMGIEKESEEEKANELAPNSAHARRQRLKSISLDSDNAKIIEQNLGLPIAKQLKDQMNEAYKNDISSSCDIMDPIASNERSIENHPEKEKTSDEDKSPNLSQKKSLRYSADTQSFIDVPRFSPKEFAITVTTDEGVLTSADAHAKKKGKNLRNLTIDLTKRDSDLEKELLEFEKLYTDAEEKKVKTPTLKVKATSLDSSESVNLSLPQTKTLEVPQNSVSVPNTPKRQLKRLLAQKNAGVGKIAYNAAHNAEQRRLYIKGQDSGIFLRENHASLMLYQPGTSRISSRTMSSFDENIGISENTPEINVSETESKSGFCETGQTLGSNLINYKQNLSVSSTNLKTLPEGVPSDDFEPSEEDDKLAKKLHRRNSNQSLKLGTHSLQSSNCSLSSAGASCHNLNTVRTSVSNFNLSETRHKKISLERRDSNTSLTSTTKVMCSSNNNVSGESKNCLLQRRGSNNSLTLNILATNTLSRHSSNSSLNKDTRPAQKKGLLERRSSNTSLTLNINTSNPQLSVHRGLSISNYNLNGSTCNLSRFNSNQSIDNTTEPKKGILERRSSNTSLTLNIQPQEPRDIEIDDTLIESNLKEQHRDKHRKSLSTENLIPKSYKTRPRLKTSENPCFGFGSHDDLCSSSYEPRNLTYVCGDQENEIIYAFGRQEDSQGFTRNITTKPLSPQSTSEDFRMYLANMQHLQNASSILTRQQLRDLNDVFLNGYSKVKCPGAGESHCCNGRVNISDTESQPCSEYQKTLLRNLHQEFWDMPTNFQEKPIVSGSHSKNRYKSILPNEHSRVVLRPDHTATAGSYINANFIKGYEYTRNCYIATQGPLPNTIYDFWLMVLQNYLDFINRSPTTPTQSTRCPKPPTLTTVQKIVMLTNFIENNRQKCEKYFPIDLNEELTFHSPDFKDPKSFFEEKEKTNFTVKNVGVIKKPGYTIRKLEVRYQSSDGDTSMAVYHYWFDNWADHKCPNDVNALLSLSLDVLKDEDYDFSQTMGDSDVACKCVGSPSVSKFAFPPLEPESISPSLQSNIEISENLEMPSKTESVPCMEVPENAVETGPPVVVHCSAGVGRTGCLLAILAGVRQLTRERRVDVLGIVCNLRLSRGGMVQNSEQYELIHRVLCLFERGLPEL